MWPDGPVDRALILAAIERLESRARPARRRRRLPEKDLPPHLQATEEQRLDAGLKVARLIDELNAKGKQI
jgi:hypothetical protein